MTELKYDPELPFAVIIREDHQENTIVGRCSSYDYAEQLVNAGSRILREIVDTTPKPKIPEDAEFVRWDAPSGKYDYYARKMSGGSWRLDRGTVLSLTELIQTIGDSEVTVLVAK